MKEIWQFLNKSYEITNSISISILDLIVLTLILAIATFILRGIKKLITRNLPLEDKKKFKVVFIYARWLTYVIIVLITLHMLGVNVTGIFAASAALLIGVGLALQTLFQAIAKL